MKLATLLTTFLLATLSVWGLPALSVYAQTGGPDNFDYEYADSNEPSCNTSYEDISSVGTPLDLADDGESNVTAPFPITLYGTTSTDLRIGNNGGLFIGATTGELPPANVDLPLSIDLVNNGPGVLPFWDDLDSDSGNVFTHTLGTTPDRRFIVQWHQRPHYDGQTNPDTASFQVIFYEQSTRIDFVYSDVDFSNEGWDFGASATIGLNQDTANALQYSSKEAVILTGASPVSAICFQRRPQISLEVTVGPDLRTPEEPEGTGCSSEKTYTVFSGEAVQFCYRVINNSLDITYTHHDLVSSKFGTLLSSFPHDLQPGDSIFLSEWKENALSNFTETATWTVSNASLAESSTDSASVSVLGLSCPADQVSVRKYFYDFEDDNGGGTATNDWQWGVVQSAYPPNLGGAHSGQKAWATVLDGPYSNLDDHSLLSFEIDLTGITGPVGIFWYQYLQSNDSGYDQAKITANGDEIYSSAGVPDESNWNLHHADLSSYAGEHVTLVFDFYATDKINDIGWYIDDLFVQYCPRADSILEILYYPILSATSARANSAK